MLCLLCQNQSNIQFIHMLYIDLRPGQAVKIGNAPVQITGAFGRGISGYELDCRGVELSAKLWRSQEEERTSNYYITPVTGSSSQLEIRCGRENQHPERLGPQTPDWAVGVQSLSQLEFRSDGEKMLEWGTCPREAGPPGPRLSSPRERERNAVIAITVGVNILQFCSASNSPLTQ